MQPIHKLLFATAALALAGGLAPAAASTPALAAQVAQAGPCNVTLTGPITQVISANEFAIRVDNRRVGSIHVYDANAQVSANGLSLGTGEYAAVTGCFSAGMRSFNASQVTLAGSRSAYQNVSYVPQGQVGPCHVSLFGTITQVWRNGVEFTLQTNSRVGNIHVYDKGSRMNLNGLNIQNGMFAGVYGCFINNQRFFHANEVTLATSAASYNANVHPTVTASGTVDEVGRGWIGVLTRYYGHVHVLTNQTNIRTGERVSIQGTYNVVTRQLTASSITVL